MRPDFIQDEGRPNHPVHRPAVEQLLAVGAVQLVHLARRIGEDHLRQLLVVRESGVHLGLVARDADDAVAGIFEDIHSVAEVARLTRAGGRTGLAVEVHDRLLAAGARQGERMPGLVGQREIGGERTGLETNLGGHVFSVPRHSVASVAL